MKTLVRVHVMLPREVVDEIDSRLREESRSQYVLKAIESELIHDRQREALAALREADPPTDTPPEWTKRRFESWQGSASYGTLAPRRTTESMRSMSSGRAGTGIPRRDCIAWFACSRGPPTSSQCYGT